MANRAVRSTSESGSCHLPRSRLPPRICETYVMSSPMQIREAKEIIAAWDRVEISVGDMPELACGARLTGCSCRESDDEHNLAELPPGGQARRHAKFEHAIQHERRSHPGYWSSSLSTRCAIRHLN
jgi:hypothetical protein